MKRRHVLSIVGGGVIAAAGLFYGTREPTRARAPWREAGVGYLDPRKRALSHAILAPNPHNRQPWMVDLSEAGRVLLYVDTDRMLPQTDPFNRQITVGLGCFLELMDMAAAADGYRVDLDLFPEGSNPDHLTKAPVAVATFVRREGIAVDPLFAHVFDRRSHKRPFDMDRPVSAAHMDGLLASGRHGTRIGGTNDGAVVAALRRLTHDALALEIETSRTYRESVDLFRIGKREIEANPDGIDFSGPLFETLALLGLFNRKTALDPTSSTYAEGVGAVLKNTDTAMAHVWVVTEANDRESQIAAGRDWLRVNLAAT
ncbi:MAG: hypothetical protein K9H11_02785, partial [Rhodospirillum sp.]|nr:hypothetical protein [Rhodospirillum sp.]